MIVKTSRRNFMIAAGSSTLVLPMFEAFTPSKAQAAFENARQALFYYTANGTARRDLFFPQGGTATQFTLGNLLSPLEPHKADLLILENLDSRAAMDRGADPHAVGFATTLSGAKPLDGTEFFHGACNQTAGCAGGSSGWGGGASVDQIIGQAQKAAIPNHPYASFNFALKPAPASLYTRLSYTKPGQEGTVNPESNPQVAFDTIFASAVAGGDEAAKARAYLKNKSVLDELNGEFDQLLPRLSSLDRLKLQQHQESIRSLEKTLAAVNVAGSCATVPPRPTLGDSSAITRKPNGHEDDDPDSYKDIELRQDVFRQMTVIGLACGMTRVASLLTAYSRADTFLPFLQLNGTSITKAHHDISHDGDVPLLEVVNQWYAKKIGEFWGLLKSTMGPDGKMLSETSAIFWCNELAEGNHSHNNKPHLVVGSMGGYLKNGLHYKAPGGTPHNLILTALAKGAGLDIDHVGDPEYKNYDLSAITNAV